MITADLLKLRRSAVWLVVLALPALALITGTGNYAANQGVLSAGWDAYWSQVVVFHSLFFLSLGVAVLASSVWRPEHVGHNWNLLMAAPSRPVTLVLAKLTTITLLLTVMQAVLVLGAWAVGRFLLDLDGPMPMTVPVGAALGAIAGIAVAAWQSFLSMTIRSFAAPIALALPGIVLGMGFGLSGQQTLATLLPFSLVTQALSTGSTAMSDAAAITPAHIAQITAAALFITLPCVGLSALWLRIRDVRS